MHADTPVPWSSSCGGLLLSECSFVWGFEEERGDLRLCHLGPWRTFGFDSIGALRLRVSFLCLGRYQAMVVKCFEQLTSLPGK